MKRIIAVMILTSSMCYAKALQDTKSSGKPDSSPGRVIFITGSCSSGKSSLSKIVSQELNANYFAFDEYVMPRMMKKMVEKRVGKILAFFVTKLFMRNFFTFVGFLSDKTKYEFQKQFLEELRGGIAIEPTLRMYQQVRYIALQGQDVVIEAPLHLGDGIDCEGSLAVLEGLDVLYVLAYCPWQKLVERIEQRNKTKDKRTHRELDWAIGNFLHCFEISPIHKPGAIDHIQGDIVRNAVVDYATSPIYKKKRLRILDETMQETLQVFKDNREYYIYPKRNYDLIINTGAYSAAQGAAMILDFMMDKERVQGSQDSAETL